MRKESDLGRSQTYEGVRLRRRRGEEGGSVSEEELGAAGEKQEPHLGC